MKLIDADKLNKDIQKAEEAFEAEMTVLGAEAIKSLIDIQPEVWSLFTGRCAGKKAFSEYVALCKLLDHYGVDSTKPVDSFKFILEAYQKVILECTGSQMSKLTYTPEAVISCICDRQTELAESETIPQAMWSSKTVDGKPAPCHCTNCGGIAHTEEGNMGCQTITEDILSSYCPNCGAKMLNGEHSEN